MPARAATAPAFVALPDLRACTDVADIYALFRKLQYPVETPPVAVPLDVADLPGALRDEIHERYLVAQISGARVGDPAVTVTLFVLNNQHPASELIRGIAQTWTRRFAGDHFLVFAVHDPTGQAGFRQITFINARRLGEGADVRIKLHKLAVDRTHPTRHDLDTLNGIAVATPGMMADALYRAQCEAFDVERVTDAFYKEYARRFREVMERIKADNKGIRDFYDVTGLHTFTQRLFGRLMFLYFLQKKGALNEDPNFVTAWYERTARDDGNFYNSVLEPLFFDTLNRPRDGHRSARFGRVPYLNGGLFAEDKDDHKGNVYVDNEVFDSKSENGLLYFLNRHNFTIEEDTPLEVQVALDPEMLGKVFENLLEVEERGKSGTFYTPRPVVAFMCREALASYLSGVEGLRDDQIGWLLDEAETGEPARDDEGREHLTNASLHRGIREHVEQALESVRVLDPAVGSGAFPLGMLALLVGVRRTLYRIGGAALGAQIPLVEGWKRNFIRDCLYGVDIRREAIEIARLRLWLSLVVDADPFTMEPLPNLDYKLMAGDSLIETLDGIAIYPTRPDDGPTQGTLVGGEERNRLVGRLRELQASYFQPDDYTDRAELKQRIADTEVALVEQALHERRKNEELGLKNVLQKLANLSGRAISPALSAEQQALTRSIQVTERALQDIRVGKSLPFFLYRLHFASVFAEKDGFDIVIANPPYVRHEKVAQETLAALKAAYPAVAHGMADLYVYFYARALQLLHDGGTLCFISSNKFFRTGYGKGLVQLITQHTGVRTLIDFGDFPVFDAVAYPCVVITDKGKPAANHSYRALTAGPDIELDKLGNALVFSGQTIQQLDGVHPPAGSAATEALVDKLMNTGTPLRDYGAGSMYRGIVSGLNEAFVITRSTRDMLIQEDAMSIELIRPYVRGRDIARYTVNYADLYLLYVGWHCDISKYPAVLAHLSLYREKLAARPESATGRVPWYALSRFASDYYQEFAKPKIVSIRFGLRAGFAFDSSGSFCNDAIYFYAPGTRWLTALLNSSVCNICLTSICPSVQNGYSQFFVNKIEELPIVEPSNPDKRRLDALVDELQAIGGEGPHAEELEREVDEIVYRTYGLTHDEIAEIDRWHEERRALLGNGKQSRGAWYEEGETNG